MMVHVQTILHAALHNYAAYGGAHLLTEALLVISWWRQLGLNGGGKRLVCGLLLQTPAMLCKEGVVLSWDWRRAEREQGLVLSER